jgi:YesN/AraC family two-component response regulator
MLEAKALLLQTDLTIGELSNKLGFVDPSYFSKMFKSKNGKIIERWATVTSPYAIQGDNPTW